MGTRQENKRTKIDRGFVRVCVCEREREREGEREKERKEGRKEERDRHWKEFLIISEFRAFKITLKLPFSDSLIF